MAEDLTGTEKAEDPREVLMEAAEAVVRARETATEAAARVRAIGTEDRITEIRMAEDLTVPATAIAAGPRA